ADQDGKGESVFAAVDLEKVSGLREEWNTLVHALAVDVVLSKNSENKQKAIETAFSKPHQIEGGSFGKGLRDLGQVLQALSEVDTLDDKTKAQIKKTQAALQESIIAVHT